MAMFQVVDKVSHADIKSAFRFEKVKTDNTIFRLHYKWSVWFVLFYKLCYSYVFMSNSISCLGSNSKGKGGVRSFKKAINDYCWVHGTYTVTNLDPDEEIYPGIGGVTGPEDSIRHFHYYKWMYFYMTLMVILLNVPRFFWRNTENGRLASLVKKLTFIDLVKDDEDIGKEKESLANYLYCHVGYHRRYAYGFVFAEFLNIIVSLALMMIWDWIADHEFSRNGGADFSVLHTRYNLRTDRLAKVFPLLGKCTYRDYGVGGNIQPHDFVCILPLNVINERAAVFFWYYFMMLVAVGIGGLIFRFALIGSKRLRWTLLSGLLPFMPREDVGVVVKTCSYCDWFVIYQLGLCVEPVLFREVMEKLVRKLRNSKFLE